MPSLVLCGVFYGAVLFFLSNEIHLALLYDLKKNYDYQCDAQLSLIEIDRRVCCSKRDILNLKDIIYGGIHAAGLGVEKDF